MASPLDLDDPTAVALAVLRALRAGGIEAALHGGLALAAYGEPRETRDADVGGAGAGGAEGLAALAGAGLDVRLAFDRVRLGGLLITRLTVLGGRAAPALNSADLVEPRSPRYTRLALDRSVTGVLRPERIRVLSPEDFVLFKVLSSPERDVEDATAVARALARELDRALVEGEGARLQGEIPDHDVAGRLRRVLAAA